MHGILIKLGRKIVGSNPQKFLSASHLKQTSFAAREDCELRKISLWTTRMMPKVVGRREPLWAHHMRLSTTMRPICMLTSRKSLIIASPTLVSMLSLPMCIIATMLSESNAICKGRASIPCGWVRFDF